MVRIFGKAIPVWLVVLALVVAGAGAAVGTILAGNITGDVPVTVGQALTVNTAPAEVSGYLADQFFGSRKDDGTAFTAAAVLDTGDEWQFEVNLINASDNALVGEATFVFPDGLTLDVVTNSGNTTNVTRTGLYTWKFNQAVGTGGLKVKVGVADDAAPGFYQIQGTIKQVAY